MLNQGDKYVLLTFDTESDIGSWTQDYTSIDSAMPKILDMLDEKGVKATFFWEAKAALHNPEMLRETHLRGHECGCHTYQHETVGQPGYFIPGDRAVLEDEIYPRLKKNMQTVEKYTGVRPTSFRAPRLWGDKTTVTELCRLGFTGDSTYQVAAEGDCLFPYRPSADDISKRGGLPITEFPVFALYGDMLEGLPQELKDYAVEMTGGLEAIGQWPVLRLYGAKLFVEMSKPFIERQLSKRGYSVLTIYQHPWEFLPMPGVLDGPEATCHLRRTLYENTGDFAMTALSEMIDIYRDMEFEFVTVGQMTDKVRDLI